MKIPLQPVDSGVENVLYTLWISTNVPELRKKSVRNTNSTVIQPFKARNTDMFYAFLKIVNVNRAQNK